jgi:hypothetical protein
MAPSVGASLKERARPPKGKSAAELIFAQQMIFGARKDF